MEFLINGIPYDFDGWVMGSINGKNKSTLKMSGVYSLADPTSRNILTFPLYSKVELKNDFNRTLFRGVIKESIPTDIGNQFAIKPMKIQVYDYKEFLADGISISRTFRNANPMDVINWVFESLNQENTIQFELDNEISFGLDMVIENWTIQDGTPYDILNELANRTNSRFWVRDTKIYFKSWMRMIERPVIAVQTIVHDDYIDIPSLTHAANKFELQESSSFGYANSIIIRSRNVISENTFVESFPIRDGQTGFTTNFDVGEIQEVWLYDSRFDNWRQLFVRESRWTEGPYNQWYEIKYTQGNKFVEYNENLPQLLNGQSLYVEYYSIGRGVSIQNNNQEIERVINASGYGDGRIVYIEEKDDITSQTDLDNYAISILDKMSTPRKDYIITSFVDLRWEVSDIVKINEEFYVIDSIGWNHQYVKWGPEVLEFTYNLTNTKNDNQQINYYDNRLLTDSDVESVIQEELVNAQLTMTISEWEKRNGGTYPNILVEKADDYQITLFNKNNEIFHQQIRTLEGGENYELEVTLSGEPMKWKVFKQPS